MIQQGVHGRRPGAGWAADDVAVDDNGAGLIFHSY
jgi:hypothetical protein